VALADDAMRAGLEAEPLLTVAAALAEICRITEEDSVPPRILVGGSLYLVGDVLADNGTPPA
jgi:dihydrofolate synthase/folylpolyglutamate synthase